MIFICGVLNIDFIFISYMPYMLNCNRTTSSSSFSAFSFYFLSYFLLDSLVWEEWEDF